MAFQPGFLTTIVVILLVSRLFGEAAQRLGQPAVIGQLVAGLLLGPSCLGWVWPQAQRLMFPPDPAQKAMLQAFAEYGILLLLALTGMETDRRLLRKIGRPAITVSLTGIAVPFLCGAALGFLLPQSLLPGSGRRLTTALFLGVALSISSIKIVAAVMREANFERRDLGQILVASSILEDSLGWIIIAVILGLAGRGAIEFDRLAWTVAGVGLFIAASLTVGRRVVATAIRTVNDAFVGEFMVLTLILVIVGAMAVATQAIGVQTVLGAFVAGVLIGESPILTKAIAAQLRGMVAGLFAPLFFTLAGLNADLTVLKSPGVLLLTLALLAAACFGKFLGAFVGGALGRLSKAESLALAVGMNARGSTEIIIASIGLSTGALTPSLYSMIVAMAVLTTLAMPPTLRWALARVPFRPGEQERLEREAFEAKGFVAPMERFLVAASDHPNGRLASRLIGLLAGPRGQPATVLEIESEVVSAPQKPAGPMVSDVKRGADHARDSRPDEAADAPEVAIKTRADGGGMESALADEAPKGYDFLVIGLDPAAMAEGGFSPAIAAAARSFEGPVAVAVARGIHKRDPASPLKILAPVTGQASARRAAELAIELARAARAPLTILSLSPPHRGVDRARGQALADRHEEAVLREVVEIADRRDQPVRLRNRSSANWPEAILREAESEGATLIVLGVTLRPSEALLFGETANRLVEASSRSLLFVAS